LFLNCKFCHKKSYPREEPFTGQFIQLLAYCARK
jgi:hypothetical protein